MNDLHETWQSVFKKARSQDDQAKELLLGRLTLKAASDPNFQRELRSDPDEVVRREAKELDIKPTKGLIEAAGKVASAAIPGFEEAKVQALVFTTIEDMRTSFKLTLDLSRWLFIAGLVLVSVSFVAGAFRASNWSVVVSGGSGALSLLLSAVMNPLDRIRNAAGNLVQIQAAYLAFYKQLYILGERSETLTREEVISYAQEIRKAGNDLAQTITGALEGTRAASLSAERPRRPRGAQQSREQVKPEGGRQGDSSKPKAKTTQSSMSAKA